MDKTYLKGKKIYLLVLIIPLIGGLIFTGSRSSAREKSAAQAEVLALNATQKAATAEEWEKFRSQADLKIRDNITRITELHEKMKKQEEIPDALYIRKIVYLEEQVKFMKARLERFGKSQSNWESFKRGFNNEMDVIGDELEKLTADNKE